MKSCLVHEKFRKIFTFIHHWRCPKWWESRERLCHQSVGKIVTVVLLSRKRIILGQIKRRHIVTDRYPVRKGIDLSGSSEDGNEYQSKHTKKQQRARMRNFGLSRKINRRQGGVTGSVAAEG